MKKFVALAFILAMACGTVGAIVQQFTVAQSGGVPFYCIDCTTAISTPVLVTTLQVEGLYRADVSLACKVSATGTVNVALTYVDPSGTQQTETLGTAISCTTLGAASAGYLNAPFQAQAGSSIYYTTTVTGTPTYRLRGNVIQETGN